MKRLLRSAILLACLLPSLAEQTARADVKLPAVLGSHMVLQRDKPLPIWGWADPGEDVTVNFAGKDASTKADAKGNWKVTLPAMKADGKAHKLTVSGKNKVELDDILIGEVWIGSGQSNLQWAVSQSHNAAKTIAAAKHPNIRLFNVPLVQKPVPDKDVKASWKACAPATVPGFSAVLYHFGERLHKDLDVPIGLINS